MEKAHSIQCIGFIMDGNRRWAAEHKVPALEGHAAGYATLKKVISLVGEAKIPHMVCYAFSTENWKRTNGEVAYLMELLTHALHEFNTDRAKETNRVNLRVVGDMALLPTSLQEEIRLSEIANSTNPELTVWIALSYGGRAEIVDAANRAIMSGIPVDESTFATLLWTNGMPDPDLIVRTSGEVRVSNFLLWQGAYSEYFFTNTYWPDFGETEFQSILTEYAARQRRKGA